MASGVGSAEEIRKLWRLQELVDLSAYAVSNRIFVPRRPQLVSVAEFDDEPICLFAGIEIAVGAAFLKGRSFKLTHFYCSMNPPEAMGQRIAIVKRKSPELG
jgi:hypothetical protein